MLSYEQAEEMAKAEVDRLSNKAGIELLLLPAQTMEKPYGWIFFYQSEDFIRTGNPLTAIAGNAPFIVARMDGEIHVTGTAYPIEYYLNRFEQGVTKHA